MTTPVSMVDGIGPKTTEFLKTRRITTVEALVKQGPSILETAPGFSPGRAATVMNEANRLLSGSSAKKAPNSTSKVKEKPKKSDKKAKKAKKDKDKDKDKKGKNKAKKGKKDKKKNKKNKK
jgi:predicted RecB family nuclease